MMKNTFQAAIVCLTIFTFIFFGCHSGNEPKNNSTATIHSDTGIIRDLKDVYQIFRLNDFIDITKEDISLALNEDSTEVKNAINDCNQACDSLKQIIFFYNDTLSKQAINHINRYITINNVIAKNGLDSKEFKNEFESYQKHQNEYNKYVFGRYSTSYFIKMSEESYWKNIDKKQFIKSKEYNQFSQMTKHDLKVSLALIKKIIAETKNYQEKTIYQMAMADQMIIHYNELDTTAIQEAISIYDEILKSDEYSLYKFEAWRRWRAATQGFNFGSSKESEIPNAYYEKARKRCSDFLLDYIIKHPSDEMAMNQYLDFATHGIVYRFGEYPYGNQNAIEFYELFPPIEKNSK